VNDVIGRLLGRLLALIIMAVGFTGVVWPWILWFTPADGQGRGNDLPIFRIGNRPMDVPTFMQHWLTTTAMHWCAIALGAILYHLVSRPRASEFDID